MYKYRGIILIFVLFVISGCSTVKTAIAMMQSTDEFKLFSEGNSLVYQETDFSPLAKEADRYLDQAIAVVENEQYKKFVTPVKIYAVSSLDSLENYCGFRLVLGCVVNEKLFLSPRILTQPVGTLPRLLVHELSHLHLGQQLSILEWANIPTWFREGLAVHTSTKMEGSAEMYFRSAKKTIKEGKSFYPNQSGSLIFPENHASFGLSRSIFYRQAALFIEFLHSNNAAGFKNLLISIQEHKEFSAAFDTSFGESVGVKWREFVSQI